MLKFSGLHAPFYKRGNFYALFFCAVLLIAIRGLINLARASFKYEDIQD